MLTSSISNTIRCHSVGVSCNFFGHCWFWMCWQMLLSIVDYYVWMMADVIANLFFVADVLATIIHVWWNWHEARCYGLDFLWLMLLSLVYLFGDRCCCHFWGWICLADVIANVEHFNCCKVTYHGWCYCHWDLLGWCYCLCIDLRLMLLPLFCGWCYCLVADVIATCSVGWCYCHGGWC